MGFFTNTGTSTLSQSPIKQNSSRSEVSAAQPEAAPPPPSPARGVGRRSRSYSADPTSKNNNNNNNRGKLTRRATSSENVLMGMQSAAARYHAKKPSGGPNHKASSDGVGGLVPEETTTTTTISSSASLCDFDAEQTASVADTASLKSGDGPATTSNNKNTSNSKTRKKKKNKHDNSDRTRSSHTANSSSSNNKHKQPPARLRSRSRSLSRDRGLDEPSAHSSVASPQQSAEDDWLNLSPLTNRSEKKVKVKRGKKASTHRHRRPTSKQLMRRRSITSDSEDTTASASVKESPGGRVVRRITAAVRRVSLGSKSSRHSTNSSNRSIDASGNIIPIAPMLSLSRKKRVSFQIDGDAVETTVFELPALTSRDIRNTYWSKKEVRQMSTRAQKLAQLALNQQSRRVLTCLHYCYGFADPDPISGAGNGSSAYSGMSSPQSALHYYYHFEVADVDDSGGSSSSASDGAAAASPAAATTKQPPTTTLRGLERQISFGIVDYQMQYIQAVLSVQTQIRAAKQDSAAAAWTPRQIESALCKQSTKSSLPARRFARLLGKGDAAIVGTRNGRSTEVGVGERIEL